MPPESTEANPYTINFNINLSNVSDASAANETKVISHQNQKLPEKKIEAAPIAIPVAKSLIPESILVVINGILQRHLQLDLMGCCPITP